MARNENGKGKEWDVRRNPFSINKVRTSAPELAEVPGLGITLDKLLRQGCALILGHTRDGGAVVLTVLAGEDRHRTYCSNIQELEEAIAAIDATFSE